MMLLDRRRLLRIFCPHSASDDTELLKRSWETSTAKGEIGHGIPGLNTSHLDKDADTDTDIGISRRQEAHMCPTVTHSSNKLTSTVTYDGRE